ncbi:hypothetical protein RMATCC62417_02253 [Rhizopus microsporus]|nr:hypothetical protein RMATCC62417_02253 [Rhizopus microsporus]
MLTDVKRMFSDMHPEISIEEVDMLGDTEDEEVHGGEGKQIQFLESLFNLKVELEALTEEQITKDPEEDIDEEKGGRLSKRRRTAAKAGLKLALADITLRNTEELKLLELMLDRTNKECMKKRKQASILKIY